MRGMCFFEFLLSYESGVRCTNVYEIISGRCYRLEGAGAHEKLFEFIEH